jgi:hypothetical protein
MRQPRRPNGLLFVFSLAIVAFVSVAAMKYLHNANLELQAAARQLQTSLAAQNLLIHQLESKVEATLASSASEMPVARRKKVAIITLATGKSFGQAAIDWFRSSAKHFCNADSSYEVSHLVLTNHQTMPLFTANTTRVPRLFMWPKVRKKGWPADTLSKFANLVDASEDKWVSATTGQSISLPFSSFDFVFMTDADQVRPLCAVCIPKNRCTSAILSSSFHRHVITLHIITSALQLFVQDVCEDLLGTRVALAHPQYWDRSFLTRNYGHKCQTFYPLDNDEKGGTYFVNFDLRCVH